MSDDKDRMEIDDVIDTILQKNMKELHSQDEDYEEDTAPVNDRMMVEHAKDDFFSEEEETEMYDREDTEDMKDKKAYEPDSFDVGEKIIEEAAAEIEEDQEEERSQKDRDDGTEQQDEVRLIEVAVGNDDDKKFTQKDLVGMLMYVGVILIMTFLIVHFVGQRTRVSGASMESTLSDGDNLIVDKLSYRFHDPERFDIIIFPYQYAENTYYIKRIIGLPGETVQIDYDGNIYINGEILQEHFGKETILDPGRAVDPIKLGDDEYFVLGDNRNNSSDSRFEGVANVNEDIIIGRAILRIYPFNKITVLSDD